MPCLLALGAIVNLALTQPNWHLLGFANVAIRANGVADYSSEIASLSFAPIDPDIIEDAGRDVGNSTGGEGKLNIETRVPTDATATPLVTSDVKTTLTSLQVPTLPLPTLPLPTLPISTLPLPTDIVPTLPLPTIDIPDLPVPTIQLPVLPLPTLPLSLP